MRNAFSPALGPSDLSRKGVVVVADKQNLLTVLGPAAHSSSRAVQLRAGAGRLWAPSAAAAASVDGVYIGTQYGSRLDLQHGGWRGGGGDNLQCGAATSSEAGRWAAYVSAWQHKRVWPHVCQSTRLRSFLEATG